MDEDKLKEESESASEEEFQIKDEVEKAQLDSDDILDELGLTSDKAELDIDDVELTEQTGADKAILDKDDFQGLEEVAETGFEDHGKTSESEEVLDDGEATAKKAFPRKKIMMIAAVSAGTIILFLCGGLVSYFLFTSPPDEVVKESLPEKFVIPEIFPDKVDKSITALILEPFLIPMIDAEKSPKFMTVDVFLNLQPVEEKIIIRKKKEIRAVIYTLLRDKKPQDLLKEKRLRYIQKELQMLLNNLFQDKVVLGVQLSNLELV